MATVSPGGLLAPEAGASRPRAAVGPPRRHRQRGWLLLVAVVLALFCVGDVPGASRAPTGASPALRLPVLGEPKPIDTADRTLEDIGDPFVLPVVGGVNGDPRPAYVVYWTTDWRANVPTAVSTDLVHWQRIDDALPTLPSWAAVVHPPARWSAPPGVSTMTWGPTVTPTAGGWLMYYSTRSAAAGVQCLGVGFSASATGPFVDSSSAPLVCRPDLGGDIDPSVLTTTTGQRALVWKNDGNSAGVPVGIWEQPLTPDGRAVTGSPVRLIVADEPWEHGIIEGPSMLADPRGGWWLFYSGGTWQSDTYDTGIAWCATPSGPCRKPIRTPFLGSVPTAVSPGGFDTFVDVSGRLWASYSAFPRQPADAREAMRSPRVLELAPLRLT